MPRNGVEPLSFDLQTNALTLKQPKLINMLLLIFFKIFMIWRKIDSNYHYSSASTVDYQLSDFPLIFIQIKIIKIY
jgi:hypothetical protein